MVDLGFVFNVSFAEEAVPKNVINKLREAEDSFSLGEEKYRCTAIVSPVLEGIPKNLIMMTICFRHRIKKLVESDMTQAMFQCAFEHVALLATSAFISFPQLCSVNNVHLMINGVHYYMDMCEPLYWPHGYQYDDSSEISWKQTLSWMLSAIGNSTRNYVPLYVNAMFMRQYEQLHIAVSALEKIYVPEEKGIKERLKNRIPKLISYADSKEIKCMYDCRSEYVHGNVIAPYAYIRGWEQYDPTIAQYTEYALELLRETFRLLIKNNASKVIFDEKSYNFIS